MADIEDDLLDLAGGSSGDEASDNGRRSRSGTPKKRSLDKKTKRRSNDDDSEEEGEAISEPGTPNSLESAPMDESDSDDDAPRGRSAANDDEKYPLEGMYVDHAEKARIMALPELEREQIIAERVSEVERQRQNRLLRQMVENEERKQTKKKRSADTAELEDDDKRKASRARTGKGETAMDSLRRARAEKQRRREDQERRGKDNYSPRRSESRDRDDSDDDFGRDSRSPEREPPRDAPPAELRDFERVRVGRNQFAEVCFTPGFENAISGCFIRIALGPHPETGIEQYRMASIKGFTTGRPYALAGPNGQFVTDQYVKALHGKAPREFPFIAASSGAFTDSEFNRYKIACSNDAVKVPTKAFLSDKIDDINSLIRHKWTDREIKDRLTRRTDLIKRFDPAEKERIGNLLDDARRKGEDDKVEELQEKLDQLGAQRLAFRTSLGPLKAEQAQTKNAEQDRLAERNRENRRLNAEAVRKAQLKEKAKTREAEEALRRSELAAQEAMLPTASKTNGTAKPEVLPNLAKLQAEKQAQAKGVPTIHKPLMDDDVIGALDLDIDVDI